MHTRMQPQEKKRFVRFFFQIYGMEFQRQVKIYILCQILMYSSLIAALIFIKIFPFYATKNKTKANEKGHEGTF